MSETLGFVLMMAVWFALQWFVLPRLGVPT